MNVVSDGNEDEEEEEAPRTRNMSVEELSKMSFDEQLTTAIKMSMPTKRTPSTNSQTASNKEFPSTPPIALTASSASTSNGSKPVDRANINWPSMSSNQADTNTPSSTSNPLPHSLQNGNLSMIGGPGDNEQSAFGFILGATASASAVPDGHDASESIFHNLTPNKPEEELKTNHSATTNHDHSSKDALTAATTTTPSMTSLTGSPPPAAPLVPVDDSVLSQLKRAEQQHERSRKRIWSQIKQCLEREQRIKEREVSLNEKLAAEKAKKEEAESAKKVALQNMDFEEAEKTKHAIRRANTSVQDIHHRLNKCSMDIKKIQSEKAQQEEGYVAKNRAFRERLSELYGKHEEAMNKEIRDEFKRIEKEIKSVKGKLKRVEREIQLDDKNIQECSKKLEEIEDHIKDDVEPFQETLDLKQSEKTALEMEIEALERALREKREELEVVEREMEGTNAEIMKVRKQYKDEMDEVEEEQNRYQQSQDKFNLQRTEYVMALNGLDQDNAINKKAEKEFEEELDRLKVRMTRISESFNRFEGKKERHNKWSEEEQRLMDEQVSVNKTVEKIKYEIERLEKELKQIEAKSTHHRQTVATIDSALPILHSDKTTAVNNENYLEAGKIHKNIQQKTQQKESSMEKLKALNTKSEDIKDRLKLQKDEEVTLKQQLEDIKRKRDQLRFDLVMDHRVTIKESLAAIDVDDDVEGKVLQLEMEQIEQELAMFNERYGWNTALKEKTPDAVNEPSNGTDDPLEGMNIAGSNGGAKSQNTEYSPSVKEEDHPIANDTVEDGDAEGAEDEEEETERTKEEVVEQLKHARADAERMEAEKEEVQNEINKAVANDQFEVAGQLAPKKKKLIAQIADKQRTVERLEKELEQCIARESERQPMEEAISLVEDEAVDHQAAESKEQDAASTMDSVLAADENDHANGKGNESEKIELGQNGIIPGTVIDEVDEAVHVDVDSMLLGKDEERTPTHEVEAEGADKSSERVETNEDALRTNKESEDEDDMFGDMEVVEDEDDTVNVD